MIYGIGIDIVENARLKKWVKDDRLISRFFNEKEFFNGVHDEAHDAAVCQHYASRFAVKEAFSKALGTGLIAFNLRDIYVEKASSGRPEIILQNSAKKLMEERCKNAKILVTLSHEKSCSVACVVIEVEK